MPFKRRSTTSYRRYQGYAGPLALGARMAYNRYRRNATNSTNTTAVIPIGNRNVARKRYVKKKGIHQRALVDGQGGSRSKFFYGKRRMPKAFAVLKRAISRNYYLTNTSGRASITAGLQYNQILLTMFNQADLNTISQKISANQTNRALFQSCSANTMITNQDSGNVVIEIYDCIARRDLSAANVVSPTAAWNNSYADEGGSNTDNQIVGSTPFSSDLFTQYFKVLKITHVILGQGQTHQHQVHFQPNRIMDGEYIQYMVNGAKGLTCFSFMVFRGAPYNDSMTKSSVTTGTVELDWVTSKQYKYTWTQDNDTTWSKTNSLPSSFAVGESIMDIGSGVPVTNAPA